MGRFIFRCLILSFLWSEKLPRQTPKWFLEPRAMEPWWQQCIRVANGKRGWGSTDVWSGVGLVGLVVGTEIFERQLQHTYPRNIPQIPKNHLVYFCFILWICVICGTYQVCSGGLRTGTFWFWMLNVGWSWEGDGLVGCVGLRWFGLLLGCLG